MLIQCVAWTFALINMNLTNIKTKNI